jgi:hypothetical protein
MTIHNLFKNSPFGPEEIAILVAAYDEALRTLGLAQRDDDPLAELVAKQIIAIAQTGVRDPAILAARAIKDLGLPSRQ